MRTVEVFAALDALALNATAQWPFEQFRKVLEKAGGRISRLPKRCE